MYFLISMKVIVERQMLVHAQNLTQAQTKALHPDNQGKWRELPAATTWYAEALQAELENEEYPEVVE
jgi:hypothetical protein